MEFLEKPVIYTIGHSTHPLEEFIEMLKSFNIEVLADVRRFAGSKRYPWFSKENLEKVLPKHHIEYIHFEALGGRRKVQPNSINSRWKNESFRGYADYMQTEEFTKAVEKLESIARIRVTTFMFRSRMVELPQIYDLRLPQSKRMECGTYHEDRESRRASIHSSRKNQ